MTYFFWTEEEDALAIRMHRAGIGREKIAPHLPGRTAASVGRRLSRLGIEPNWKRWTDEEFAKAKSLYATGLSHIKIAEQLPGRSPEAVHAVLKERKALRQKIYKPNSDAKWRDRPKTKRPKQARVAEPADVRPADAAEIRRLYNGGRGMKFTCLQSQFKLSRRDLAIVLDGGAA